MVLLTHGAAQVMKKALDEQGSLRRFFNVFFPSSRQNHHELFYAPFLLILYPTMLHTLIFKRVMCHLLGGFQVVNRDSDSGRLAVETWQAGIDFVNLKHVKL
jgi:hypothetical protein